MPQCPIPGDATDFGYAGTSSEYLGQVLIRPSGQGQRLLKQKAFQCILFVGGTPSVY